MNAQMEYYKSLPRKRMGSGVIIRNPKGEMLVLRTTYKGHWEIPGGVVEENESPKQTAERGTKEEIGLAIDIKRALVIHYRSAQDDQDENLMFVFDGGIVEQIAFQLEDKEISEVKFVSFQDAIPLVGERIASRLLYGEQALKEGKTIYLESTNGLHPDFIS